MKALVISGGGALGAWGGGLIQGLVKKGKKWDTVIGTSTGALLAPMIALAQHNPEHFSTLRQAYTSVTNKDIFTFDPFTKKGKINIPKVLWRLVWAKIKNNNVLSLGDSSQLLTTIRSFFSFEDYIELKNSGTEVMVCVYNISRPQAHYYKLSLCSSDKKGYLDFTEKMWISANAPIVMSTHKIADQLFYDGGVGDHIPVEGLLNDFNIEELDVVIHRHEEPETSWNPKNIFSLILKTLATLHLESSRSDLSVAMRMVDKSKLHLYYLDQTIRSNNSLLFDPKKMLSWWEIGFNSI